MNLNTFIISAKKQIDNCKYVFFDVFDTLLSRDCEQPEDVFDFIEKQYNVKEFNEAKLNNFRKLRKVAETSYYEEGILPDLNQIYERIPMDNSLRSVCKAIEIEIENKICVRKKIGYELYCYAKKKNKYIVAVSDMYLSSEVIYGILKSAGYDIDDIYVSCEYGVDKTHGQLYKKVLQKLSIEPDEVVHFGDNFLADVVGARIAGIKSYRLPEMGSLSYFKKGNDKLSNNNYLRKFILNRCQLIKNIVSKQGYEVFGPVVVGFCQWLHEHITNNRYDKVLFCARDMLQTFRIYEKMYPEHRGIICYFYASVKSIETPFQAVMGANRDTKAREQLQYLREYLDQIGCKGTIAIVDSGFSGRSQKMLTKILDGRCKVHGLYMRVNRTFSKNITDKQTDVFLYTNRPDERYYMGAAFFETLIAATHGRTIGYKKGQDGMVEPVFGPPNPNSTKLKDFQEGIYLFLSDYQNSLFFNYKIEAVTIQDNFLNFCFFPRKKDVEAMDKIDGGDETYTDIVIKREKYYYFSHWLQFFLDLKNTSWKGGFLANHFGFIYPFVSIVYIMFGRIYLKIVGESRDLLC